MDIRTVGIALLTSGYSHTNKADRTGPVYMKWMYSGDQWITWICFLGNIRNLSYLNYLGMNFTVERILMLSHSPPETYPKIIKMGHSFHMLSESDFREVANWAKIRDAHHTDPSTDTSNYNSVIIL